MSPAKKEDPDGFPSNISTNSEQSFEKGHGVSSKNLAMLSGKTDKIMASYEAYLSEIQTEEKGRLRSSSSSSSSSDDDDDSARENEDIESALPGGALLQRAWNYDDDDDDDETAPVSMSDITSVGPATIGLGMSSSHGNSYGGDTLLRGRKKLSRRAKYAQPWMHSHKGKGGRIVMIALSVLAVVAVITTVGLTRNDKKMGASMDAGNDSNDNGLIEPDWEAAYKAEVQRGEVLLAELDVLEHEMEKSTETIEMEKRAPPPTSELNSMDTENNKETKEDTQEEDNVVMQRGPPTEEDVQEEDNVVLQHHQLDPQQAESDTESFEVQQAAKSEPSGTDPIIQVQTTEEQGDGDANAQEHYYTAAMQYTPKMYDRSHGWTGQTYEEAIAFCKNAADGMAVCPYDALCPEGVGSEPLGGYRGGPHGDWAWIPVSDRFNEWVQAGAREECVRYSHKFGVDPEWGVTGKGIETELVTQNVMCCLNVA